MSAEVHAATEPAAAPASPSAEPPFDAALMHHEYDGIQEYDNPLPFWWSAIFILCIVHAAWYLLWYRDGGPGTSVLQDYAADLRAYEKLRAAAPIEEIVVDEAKLTDLTLEPAAVNQGRAVFVKNCVSCHLDDGRGQIGPNLTDRYQIHGSTRVDVYTTIHDGVPDKGMLTWNGVLSPDELVSVTAYVITLRGKDVPGGKTAQGHPVEPFRRSP